MNSHLLILSAVGLATILLAWYFVGYPLLMGLVAIVQKPPKSDLGATPFISVIIPTYNEETVIEHRVANLEDLTYPNDSYEVLFVDSGSTDETISKLRQRLEHVNDLSMRVVKESERRGKASAINTGIANAEGEIVLVSDANTHFDAAALTYIGSHFADPTVGGVAGTLRIPNPTEGFLSSNQFYLELEELKGMGETRIDSVCQFVGEISAWRAALAHAEPGSLAEDLELSVRIRRQGYAIRYDPRAVAYEPQPETAAEQITSNKRRLIGILQTIARHRDYLLIPVDRYRAVIFPSRKTLQLCTPFLFSVIGFGSITLLAMGAYTTFGAYLTVSAIGGVLLGASLLAVKSHVVPGDGSVHVSIRTLGSLLNYLIVIEYAILLAWKDYFTGTYTVLWQKSESDRQTSKTD